MENKIKNIEIIETNIPIKVSVLSIQGLIYTLRNVQVMLDFDLADIYGYEVKRLNEQVKRNIARFPEDFMFQLTSEEIEVVKSQNATSRDMTFFTGQMGGRRKPPYAFTEQGIYMLGTVLRGVVAEQQTIRVMRAFREMRHFIANNALMFEKISMVELKQLEYQKRTDEKIEQIFEYISDCEEVYQKIFFDGQIFDAFSLLTDIIMKADKSIVLIDGYVDIVTLNILAKKRKGVDIILYTLPSAKITAQDILSFNTQYPKLEVNRTTAFHDRFLIIDGNKGYHIGASIKDAGKKCFGINKIEDIGIINDLIQRAELTSLE